MTNLEHFASWMNDAASDKDPSDKRALATAKALIYFYEQVVRFATDADLSPDQTYTWAAIAELFSNRKCRRLEG